MGQASLFGGVGGYNTSDSNIVSKDVSSGKIAYGTEGKIVGNSNLSYYGNNNTIIESPIIFTGQDTIENRTFLYCGSKYFMSDSNNTYISSNCIDWSIISEASGYNQFAYGNGVYVGMGNELTSVIVSANNGETWDIIEVGTTTYTSSIGTGLNTITFGNGIFVIIGSGNIIYSSDGYSWTNTGPLTDGESGCGIANQAEAFANIAFYNGTFILIPYNSNRIVSTTVDFITWNNYTIDQLYCIGIAVGNGKIVAIGEESEGVNIITSEDSITWTYSNPFIYGPSRPVQIVFVKDRFILSESEYIYYSFDGETWTEFDKLGYYTYDYNNNKYIRNYNGAISFSDDFENWYTREEYQATDLPIEITAEGCETKVLRKLVVEGEWNLNAMPTTTNGSRFSAYGNEKIVVLYSGSNIAYYSTDNVNWSSATIPLEIGTTATSWNNIIYEEGKFTASSSGGSIIQSIDGITWSHIATLPTLNYNYGEIVYGNGKYIIPKTGTSFATGYISEDGGVTWQEFSWPSAQNWAWGAHNGTKFVFTSQGLTFCYSEDGINWIQGTFPSGGNNLFTRITSFNNSFIAFDFLSGVTAYSSDGINWTIGSCGVNFLIPVLACGNGRLIAAHSSDNNCAYTEDGTNWTTFTIGSGAGISGIGYGNGQFIAFVNYSSYIYNQTYRDELTLSPFITFTIDGVSYAAYEGMTWGEWCSSKWNTLGAYIEGMGYPYFSMDGTTTYVLSSTYGTTESDVIVNGHAYTHYTGGGVLEPELPS